MGIDIGTTSVKAVAADADGNVVRRARVAHDLVVAAPDQLEHRPDQAWHDGVRAALGSVADGLDVAAVEVAAMVPSMCAVDGSGRSLTPGLLYGDARAGTAASADPSQSGESVGFLRWCAAHAPEASGFWPAQAMANFALVRGGRARHDHGDDDGPAVRLRRLGRVRRPGGRRAHRPAAPHRPRRPACGPGARRAPGRWGRPRGRDRRCPGRAARGRR